MQAWPVQKWLQVQRRNIDHDVIEGLRRGVCLRRARKLQARLDRAEDCKHSIACGAIGACLPMDVRRGCCLRLRAEAMTVGAMQVRQFRFAPRLRSR